MAVESIHESGENGNLGPPSPETGDMVASAIGALLLAGQAANPEISPPQPSTVVYLGRGAEPVPPRPDGPPVSMSRDQRRAALADEARPYIPLDRYDFGRSLRANRSAANSS